MARDYQTKSNAGGLSDSITAEKLGAGEANSFLTEIKTAVSSSGQTLAAADGTSEVTDQLSMAMAIYGAGGAEYCLDTGAADAYVLNPVSPAKAIPAYFDGMTLSFKPGSVNTGASTVNYNSIGAKSITKSDGGALNAGDIYQVVTIQYNSSDDRFELISRQPMALQTFTASGTYSKPDGLRALLAILIGGGASGGKDSTQGGEGGGAGGLCVEYYTASELSASEAYVIGAGGAGRTTNGASNAGGDSTFKTLSADGAGSQDQGVGTGSSIFNAGLGDGSTEITTGGSTPRGGTGGGPGAGRGTTTATKDGQFPGAGGGGSTTGTSGTGADGILIIAEFF